MYARTDLLAADYQLFQSINPALLAAGHLYIVISQRDNYFDETIHYMHVMYRPNLAYESQYGLRN